MRRFIKILVALLAILASAAGAGVAYLFLKYPAVPAAENVTIRATPEMVARGEYLAKHVSGCVACHADHDDQQYANPVIPGTEGRGGENFGIEGTAISVLFSQNITPAGIGAWTDGELIRAFTAGVSRDGTPLFPIMPYLRYGRLSREDVHAIVAYLRTLEPVEYTPPPRELGMPLPLAVRTIPTPAQFRAIPPKSDRVAYGEYVTNAAACADCHTPADEQGQPIPGRDFAGGFEFPLRGGGVVRSANITPDATTGIGSWTEEQFIEKFKAFDGAARRTLSAAEQRENTSMPWYDYAGMTREDLGAIYTYLRSLKPVVNRVVKHN
jgi:mono/diheme cytochrome c family protein